MSAYKTQPIITHRYDHKQLMAQTRRAADLMIAFHQYAESIGCRAYGYGVLCDTIEATEEQSKKLAAWWTEHTADCPVAP